MNLHYLVPETLDQCMSYSVVSYLKKLKNQAKVELDKMVQSVGSKPTGDDLLVVKTG